MELILNVRTRTQDNAEVVVDADSHACVGDVLDALAVELGGPCANTAVVARTGSRLDPSLPVSDTDLIDGDRLTLVDSAIPTGYETAGGQWELLVVKGPEQGSRIPLSPGRHVLGRDPQCQVPVGDETVSRRHVLLDVGPEGVSVEDAGSTNGTWVGDTQLTARTPLAPGDVVEAGDTGFVVFPTVPIGRQGLQRVDGTLRFRRGPRDLPASPAARFEVPPAPQRPPKGRIPLAVTVAPALLGILMAVVMGSPFYLLFALASPVMAIWSFAEDRYSGRKRLREETEAYMRTLVELRDHLARAIATEAREREGATPTTAALVGRALACDGRLWERRPHHPDFLSFRVGTAALPSRFEIEVPDGGDPELRAKAAQLAAAAAAVEDVPVTVDLREAPVVGIAGRGSRTAGLARSLVVQAAVLDSPAEVAIIATVPRERIAEWDWLKWLPHTRGLLPAEPKVPAVAASTTDAAALFEAIRPIMDERKEATAQPIRSAPALPHLLFVLHDSIPPSAADLQAILDCAASGSASVVWVAERDVPPGVCNAVIDTDHSVLKYPEAGRQTGNIEIETLDPSTAQNAALALAPLTDAEAFSDSGLLPRSVGLLELLDLEGDIAPPVRSTWQRNRDGLDAPVGRAATGPFRIDLRTDGPHALVVGTTGSGKSRLLQSLVAGLAAEHPPSRLTFILVDYKGGSAFRDFAAVPHTVGFVTDLDAHLTQRALTSLNAELRYREEMFERFSVEDLREMERLYPDEAPPSLAIVVDEFAALADEVPEFVDGLIDVAQRGRSMGVHMVLATQSPQAITDAIRNNTNLRIALRVKESSESTAALGAPDAARVPQGLPGRAYATTGAGQLTAFQSADSGAIGGDLVARVRVRPFRLAPASETASSDMTDVDAQTDLRRLCAGIAEAAAGLPAQRRPWLPALGPLVALEEVMDLSAADGRVEAVLGLADHPARQTQTPAVLDFDEIGHAFVYGMAGAGKTTVLVTVAASLASRCSPDDVVLYGLDCASGGLLALEDLPQCAGVVSGNDTERTERLFAVLEREMEGRRERIGATGAASLAQYKRASGETLPAVVVLLDGHATFHTDYRDVDGGELVEKLTALVGGGPAVGIYFVLATNQVSSVPTQLASLVPGRIVLPVNLEDYATLGLYELKDVQAGPGRAFLGDGTEVQIAVLGGDAEGDKQAAAVRALGVELRDRYGERAASALQALPAELDASVLPAVEPGLCRAPIGLDGSHLQPVWVDLDDTPTFLIAGPDRSGRTTALATVAQGLREAVPDAPAFLLLGRRNETMAGLCDWTRVGLGPDEAADVTTDLTVLLHGRGEEEPPVLLVIDDGDMLTDVGALETLAGTARMGKIHIVVAAGVIDARRTYGSFLVDLGQNRHGIILQPEVPDDNDVFSVRLPRKATRRFPPGRGYFVHRNDVRLVQVAMFSR